MVRKVGKTVVINGKVDLELLGYIALLNVTIPATWNGRAGELYNFLGRLQKVMQSK